MRTRRSFRRMVGGVTAAAIALGAATGFGTMARAQTDQSAKPGRMVLDEDITRLSIVVMANQTPITQAEAQAVLPVLESIRTQLAPPDPGAAGADDATATALDAQLRAALSPALTAAVDAVRLLLPSPPPMPGGPEMAGPPPSGAGPGRPDGPPGGRGHRGGPGGPMGLRMLGPLTDFFRSTAGG